MRIMSSQAFKRGHSISSTIHERRHTTQAATAAQSQLLSAPANLSTRGIGRTMELAWFATAAASAVMLLYKIDAGS